MKSDNDILFIYTTFSAFVKTDYEILSEKFVIHQFQYFSGKKLKTHFLSQIKLFFWLIKSIRKCKVVYIWFADYHSLVPIIFSKIFNKKSYLVLGGYDVVGIPELKYGSYSNKLRAFCAGYSIKFASLNLAVGENIEAEAKVKEPKAKVITLHTGYDSEKFSLGNLERKKRVITVTGMNKSNSAQRFKIKGTDIFCMAAEKMPETEFVIIGCKREYLENITKIPSNVKIIDFLEQKKLIEFYQSSKVYAQFSIREGLPNAVCEAMLCGCIPVGSSAEGVKLAIGETGFIAKDSSINSAVEALKKALESGETPAIKSREYIVKMFSLNKRKSKLSELIDAK